MRGWFALGLIAGPLVVCAAQHARAEAPAAYRTDSPASDRNLPWFKLQPGQFPPLDSAHRMSGTLVDADYVHRLGKFRNDDGGKLVDFSLPPLGTVVFHNAQADLRDVPLGTHLTFFMYQDVDGQFSVAATIRDDFTMLAREGQSYRIESIDLAGGKLRVTRHGATADQADLGQRELAIDEHTRVWKADGQVKLADLTVGDDVLVSLTEAKPGVLDRVGDIWIGQQAQQLATEAQRKRQLDFLKARGLPAWIDRVEGKRVTVTFLGEPEDFAAICKSENFVPSQWASEHRQVDMVVANDELRTYNPPVDRERSKVETFEQVPITGFGPAGVRWVVEPNFLLEGFRHGQVVRLFVIPAWPVKDMPFGESVYSERPHMKPVAESPNQYPYRTDFGNRHLPWYRLKPGTLAPLGSAHAIGGELLEIGPDRRSGRFVADVTGEPLDFVMPPQGTVICLGAETELAELVPGTRYWFHMNQDENGRWKWASLITDDFSDMAGERLSYRLEAARLDEGKLDLARQLGKIKDDRDEWWRPPDVAHGELLVDSATRVWKGDQRITLADLAVGDDLMINTTAHLDTSPGRAVDIWVGEETVKALSQRQREARKTFIRQHGAPAWINSVDGKMFALTFFGSNFDFMRDVLNGDPGVGGDVFVMPLNDSLEPAGPLEKMIYRKRIPDLQMIGTYGASGMSWVVEPVQPSSEYHPGRPIRVFKHEWPGKDAAGK